MKKNRKKFLGIIILFLSVFLSVSIFADFWKELNKVVDVIEELSAPVVSNLCFADSIENDRPSGISKSFPCNTRKIHVWFNINGASPDQTISSVWMKKKSKEYVKIYELSKQAPPQNVNYMDFSLAVPENNMWPVGEYKVDIICNNKVLATGIFQITEAVKGGHGIWNVNGENTGNTHSPAEKKPENFDFNF
ncbi:MAG TPA: hypothetical protein P5105_07020 [Victivallales bacterium]|nr:hypothetical protein [Victivallales bacterium]HPO90316.1 hypothetical protein [Victivallales bacterium]HRR07018.1 hypothetical protein [Victivallales bacterium]HRR27797.1 hypothetical protein [Victivallales bacterium]HRU00236.1 hypothetical protein [Victivallales bacterium]